MTFKASLVNPQSPMVKNGAPRKPTLPKGLGSPWIEKGCEVAGCTSKPRCSKTKEFSSLPSLQPFFLGGILGEVSSPDGCLGGGHCRVVVVE